MKKLLLLALTLGLSVVSMAQAPVMITEIGEDYITEPNSLADPDNPVYYAIKCNSQQSFNTWMYDNGDTPAGGCASSDPTLLSDAGTYVWEIVPVEGKEGYYTFKNYSTGNYINISGTANGGAVEMSADEVETYITLGEGDYEDYIALRNPNATGQWIDMGWSGAGISTWGGGVGGSRRMQIFEVTLEEGDEHQGAVDNLTTVIDNVSGDLDTWAEDLGEDRWQHKQDLYDAFSEALEEANAILEDPDSYTTAEINAAKDKLQKTHDDCANNVNGATQQAYDNGYYMIVSALTFTGDVTKYYTAEEADAKNAENLVTDKNGVEPGGDGYITTYAEGYTEVKEGDPYTESGDVIKAMYEDAGTAKWMTYQKKAQFLFKLEQTTPTYVAPNTDPSKVYKVTNMLNLHTFGAIPTSSNVSMLECDSLFTFDIVPGETRTDAKYPVVDIRNAGLAEGQYYYLHCGGHGGGSGVSGNIVGWCDNNDAAATRWYLQPISDEEAAEWLNSDEAKASLMIAEMKPYVSNIPTQVETAKDIKVTIDENSPIITSGEQFSSPYTTLDEQSTTEEEVFENLINEEGTTYWHSAWEGGSVAQDVHYLQVADVDCGKIAVKMTRRSDASADWVTVLRVKGYTENDESLTFDDGADLGALNFPFTKAGETITSSDLIDATGYSVLRFYSEMETVTTRGYWHVKKFQMYPAEVGYYYGSYENTQYAKRQALADAATAAIEAWNTSAWDATKIGTGEQSITDLTAQYNTLKAAAEAWTAVYVDPADLRTALATVKPNVEMIVIGNNPGEWKATSSVVGTIKTAYDNALAYDQAGEYTPDNSKTHIDNLNGVVTDVLAAANKPSYMNWYKLHFPAEALYESADWDKTGAKAAYAKGDDQQEEEAGKGENDVCTAKALFGQYLAAGKYDYKYSDAVVRHDSEGESFEDSVVIYSPVVSSDAIEGRNVVFTDDVTAAGDAALFRFSQASDSTFYIINKATGLYLRAVGTRGRVQLSATPSTFKWEALGWGTSMITAYNIDGTKYSPLHGERSTNTLVTWDATTLGSNSMICIEAISGMDGYWMGGQTTDYSMKLWPGALYAYTFASDITLASTDNLDIYRAAEFNVVTEEKTNMITLGNKQTDPVLKAGVPYIVRTKIDGEYKSWDDAYDEAIASYDEPTRAQQKEVSDGLDAQYVTVAASHGEAEKTAFVHELVERSAEPTSADYAGVLKGTFSAVSAETSNTFATVKEDGFVKASSCDDIHSAYVDITGRNAVYSLKWQDGKMTAINEVKANDVVAPVATSNAIYNIAGQKIQKIQKGLNIVNGKKVVY